MASRRRQVRLPPSRVAENAINAEDSSPEYLEIRHFGEKGKEIAHAPVVLVIAHSAEHAVGPIAFNYLVSFAFQEEESLARKRLDLETMWYTTMESPYPVFLMEPTIRTTSRSQLVERHSGGFFQIPRPTTFFRVISNFPRILTVCVSRCTVLQDWCYSWRWFVRTSSKRQWKRVQLKAKTNIFERPEVRSILCYTRYKHRGRTVLQLWEFSPLLVATKAATGNIQPCCGTSRTD